MGVKDIIIKFEFNDAYVIRYNFTYIVYRIQKTILSVITKPLFNNNINIIFAPQITN